MGETWAAAAAAAAPCAVGRAQRWTGAAQQPQRCSDLTSRRRVRSDTSAAAARQRRPSRLSAPARPHATPPSYPMTVSSMGMAASGAFAYLLCRVAKAVDARAPVSRQLWLCRILPVGFFMAATLWAGNLVYLYLSVSFIQVRNCALLGRYGALVYVWCLLVSWCASTEHLGVSCMQARASGRVRACVLACDCVRHWTSLMPAVAGGAGTVTPAACTLAHHMQCHGRRCSRPSHPSSRCWRCLPHASRRPAHG